MRYTVGLIGFFVTILSMNAVFIYVAVSGADTVAPSYKARMEAH